MLHNLHCSKLFFGVDGIDVKQGVSCATPEEADLLAEMIRMSKTVIVLADSTKVGASAFGHICDIGSVDVLVTDSGISDKQRKALEKQGVSVMIA